MTSLERLFTEFTNPGPEWRGKPFWSWNGRLREAELLRQIHVMQEMGLGGFFMHSRTGLATEYLGDEWFDLTNACADEARRLGMEAWLYDEDRWPSGTAGGLVTRNPEFRRKFVSLRRVPGPDFEWSDDLVAAFACKLDGLAYTSCRRLVPEDPPPPAGETVLAFTIEEMEPSSFYNGYTDADHLNRRATEEFIRLTHERYRQRCGGRLGTSIRGIFTDEPHRGPVMTGFSLPNANRLWMAPWTERLPEEFHARFGYDLVERLPELFLQQDGRAVSPVKWHYMELLQELFLEAFARPIYQWCEQNGMLLTGHVLHEDSLTAQAAMQGSLMRFYEYMHYPGVDVLTEGNRNYWIVKQLQSAARQLGRKWLLSELYGCTGWQMGFQGHKAVGDWQALFGINLRCHHLSWYTMEGEAKRDYPASILHQSAWWRDYSYVETYFARLGLLLAQGRPCCDVLVLNPVESVWCQIHAGWADGLSPTGRPIQELEQAYQELFHWLAGAHVDFDYADEEMLGRLGSVAADSGRPALGVGRASYRAVVVGRMATIRSSTLALLRDFAAAGGKVIFAGDPPEHVDAVPSPAARELAAQATHLPWDAGALVAACKEVITAPVEILDAGSRQPLAEVFCQMREDLNGRRYLVAMNMSRERAYPDVLIRVRGDLSVTEWDCRDGSRYAVPAPHRDGWTEIATGFGVSGERAFVLEPAAPALLPARPVYREIRSVTCAGPYDYSLSEPNVCVLDLARWRLGEGEWQPAGEILHVDREVRRAFGLPARGGEMVQPWYREKHLPPPDVKGAVSLAFDFNVERLPAGPVFLSLERPDRFRAALNGVRLAGVPEEWWVDTAFHQILIPEGLLRLGPNTITLETDFHEGVDLEACALLGGFGVRVDGAEKVLVRLPESLVPGDITAQGLPFYGGAITYRVPVPLQPAGHERVLFTAARVEAGCVKVSGAGLPERNISWPPYEADVTDALREGSRVELEVVLTRRNTFGPLHQVPLRAGAYGPGNWTTEGAGFSEAYMLWPSGLLEAPTAMLCVEE